MSEVTIQLPVTARFNGPFCDATCAQRCKGCTWCKSNGKFMDIGRPVADINGCDHTIIISTALAYSYIRNRWCCENFGMGEVCEVTEQVYNIKLGLHTASYKIDGNLCAVDCPALVDGTCHRHYPEEIHSLDKRSDRYEREHSYVEMFGMGGVQ